jgi:CBS domain containing-hemolysin-like protein
MTLDSLIMLCGALVAILPFLGFPNSWDTVIFVVLGVMIITLGIVVRRRAPRAFKNDRDALFVENTPKQEN